MEYTQTLVEKNGYIATITLNRPEHLNAFTWTMGAELVAASRETGVERVETINHAYLAWTMTQPDIGEGVMSFLQKREPEWSMRVPDDMPDKLDM